MAITTTVHRSWDTVDATAWDALVGDGSPFVESAWLSGLVRTGCATPDTGWHPRPITVHDGDRLVAAAPAWQADHGRQWFSYTGHWRRSADKAGLSLFPALVLGVPFTPVTGERLLVAPGPDEIRHRTALLQGVARAAQDLHGVHVLFPPHAEAQAWRRRGAFLRPQWQYHWHNAGYSTYADFLARFRSKRRKEIRRERRAVSHLDMAWVDAPDPALLDRLWDVYADTAARYGDEETFLNRAFFHHLGEAFGDRLVAIVARDGDRFVGGALDVIKEDRLYGRYWGLTEEIPFLHFEVCYHQGIELSIARGLSVFEPGHGGDHKYRRGFEPVRIQTAHALPHRGMHRAFARAAEREATWVAEKLADLEARAPLKPRAD